MRRIITSLGIIIALGAMVVGTTGAFFSDTETSVGNAFVAGAIDLTIDNESYYNGVLHAATTWALSDLDAGHLFFDFHDLKPADDGEDTISLHVGTNEAYACMELALTGNDDVSTTEPEDVVDDPDVPGNLWDGELAQAIEIVWWADDGNNILEPGEGILTPGGVPVSLFDLATTTSWKIALADSENNVWGGVGGIPGGAERYIGKAWCFGTMTLDPVETPVSPQVDPGYTCSGAGLGNETQTDSTTLDLQFVAVQARHNSDFLCPEGGGGPPPPPPEPEVLIDEDFGTGDCLQDIPLWDEDPGESCPNGTVAKNIDTGDDTVSPDGGRHALIGNNGYICRSLDATGLESLQIKYYWRGDNDADAGDTGTIKFYTGGTCVAPSGEVVAATLSHDLTQFAAWSSLQTVNLPASLDNSTFLIRFASETNAGTESFRVDGVTLTGI